MSEKGIAAESGDTTATHLLDQAETARAQGRPPAYAVALGYMALHAALADGSTHAETLARVHLFLSEVSGEIGYRGFERVHARAAWRAAQSAPQDEKIDTAPIQMRLAEALRQNGDPLTAERILEGTVAELDRRQSANKLELARALVMLADTSAERGGAEGIADAEKHLDRALALLDSVPGGLTAVPELQAVQARLLLEARRRLPPDLTTSLDARILPLAERMLRLLLMQSNGYSFTLCVQVVRDLATVLRLSGEPGKLVEAHNLLSEMFDEETKRQRLDTDTVFGMVLVAAKGGNKDAVRTLCRITFGRDLLALSEQAELNTEGDTLAYAARLGSRTMTCLSLLARDGMGEAATVQLMLDMAIARKASVADAELAFSRSWRAVDDPGFAAAGATLAAARDRLAVMLREGEYRGIGALEQEVESRQQILSTESFYRRFRQSDSTQRSQVERFLRGLLNTGDSWSAVKQAGVSEESPPNWQDVAHNLQSGSVLVEFVRIEKYDAVADAFPGDAEYSALILRPDGNVIGVSLGDAAPIEAALRSGLAAMRGHPIDTSDTQMKAMARLYELVWAPIAPAIGSVRRVVISPDGALGLCPFAALVDGSGRFVIEQRTPLEQPIDLHQVFSARDLLMSRGAAVTTSEPVVFADPDYGEGKLGRLINAGHEATLVAAQLGVKEPILREKVTLSAFKALHSPLILHIITHGTPLETRAPTSIGDVAKEDRLAAQTILGRHLLTLSSAGLALTGFNRLDDRANGEGVLTPAEASELDLRGTELVVLAACDSGSGEPVASEGILGLPRSFYEAGARTVITSLWELKDVEAVEQMRTFYGLYLKNHDPVAALNDMQRDRIKRLRRDIQKAPPALWAPLIVQGRG